MGTGPNNSTTDIQHWLLSGSNHLGGYLNLFCVGFGHRVVSRKVNLRGPNKGRALLLSVFCDIHQHGSWSTRRCDVHGSCHHTRDFCGVRYQERMLGNWHCHSRDVNFLECICSHRSRKNLTGNCQKWNRIHVGICDGRHQIGSARARRGNSNTQFSRRRGITFRSVTGALLVANQNVADLVSRH